MSRTQNVESHAFRVEIRTTREIAAPGAAVWSALADRDAYAQWNSFIRSWTGDWVIGARQVVRLEPTEKGGQTLSPRIVELVPRKRLAWRGRIGIPGLLDGHHRFEIEDREDGTSLFHHAETLSGALVPLFRKMLTVDTPAAFHRMNDELARRVEAGARR
ncbi:SRPBCC domain-containing protein [Microbacterium invictum]|uniref:SRPBCC domain-containing protein n=1 Tax=Microbacterium invictum TaxID=515415 RepID=A0ABZ0VAR7_9MICO|nr:SRPBCC domain-containing protein [Microbacterium invictum]WQB70234.1 SRPBCC domain-containing protein [Microbacterium invictum]